MARSRSISNKYLRASQCLLVAARRLAADHREANIPHTLRRRLGPRSTNVTPVMAVRMSMRRGGEPDLKDDVRQRKVANREIVQGRTKVLQRRIDAHGVLGRRLHPNVEVARGAGLGVNGDGRGADPREARLSVAQRTQQIAKIRVHRDPIPSAAKVLRSSARSPQSDHRREGRAQNSRSKSSSSAARVVLRVKATKRSIGLLHTYHAPSVDRRPSDSGDSNIRILQNAMQHDPEPDHQRQRRNRATEYKADRVISVRWCSLIAHLRCCRSVRRYRRTPVPCASGAGNARDHGGSARRGTRGARSGR